MKPKRGWAVLAALLLGAAPVAAACLACPCVPRPLERPAPCDSEPSKPCCGEPEEQAPDCRCAHFESQAALPSGDDTPVLPDTTAVEAPALPLHAVSIAPDSVRPPGPDPPTRPTDLYLLNLALRL